MSPEDARAERGPRWVRRTQGTLFYVLLALFSPSVVAPRFRFSFARLKRISVFTEDINHLKSLNICFL